MTSKRSSALDSMMDRGVAVQDYLDQGEYWTDRKRVPIPIINMDREWRYNASRMLERNAARMADLYGWGDLSFLHRFGDMMGEMAQDGFERAMSDREHDPVSWIRTTTLYRTLIAELPTKPKKLAKLAARAAHFSTCPLRAGAVLAPCQCAAIGAAVDGPST